MGPLLFYKLLKQFVNQAKSPYTTSKLLSGTILASGNSV